MAPQPVRGNDASAHASDSRNDDDSSGANDDDSDHADDAPGSRLAARDGGGGPVPCFDDPAEFALPPASGELDIELGATDRATETLFVPFDAECTVPIAGIGQAGLLARLGVRVHAELRRASVALRVWNALDRERRPGENADAEEIRTWSCPGDDHCHAVPVHVEISHLNRLPELEGTLLELEVTVTPEGGDPSTRSAWGVFQRW